MISLPRRDIFSQSDSLEHACLPETNSRGRSKQSARLIALVGNEWRLARWGNSRPPISPPRARPVIQGAVENGCALAFSAGALVNFRAPVGTITLCSQLSGHSSRLQHGEWRRRAPDQGRGSSVCRPPQPCSRHLIGGGHQIDRRTGVAVDAVIYGHSHQPKIETKNGTLFFNPGSAGPRRRQPGGQARPECVARKYGSHRSRSAASQVGSRSRRRDRRFRARRGLAPARRASQVRQGCQHPRHG